MEWWVYLLIAVGVFIVLPYILMIFVVPPIIYNVTLCKRKPDTFSEEAMFRNKDEQIVQMYEEGRAWREKFAENRQRVEITSDGFKIVGEYYDFGSDKCVLIAGGRLDTRSFGAYYAEIYRKQGYNVLIQDPRCHGESSGVNYGGGIAEKADNLALIKYAHDKLGNKEISLHGVCLGAQSWVLLAGNGQLPEYVKTMVVDGLFLSLFNMFRMHTLRYKQPTFPFMFIFRSIVKHKTGGDILKEAPIKAVKHVQIPILFIAGVKDQFVSQEKSQRLYDECGSPKKKLVWMKEGIHAHLRINNVEMYDLAVKSFLEENR